MDSRIDEALECEKFEGFTMTLRKLATSHLRVVSLVVTTQDGSTKLPSNAVKAFLSNHADERIRLLDGKWCSIRPTSDYVAITISTEGGDAD